MNAATAEVTHFERLSKNLAFMSLRGQDVNERYSKLACWKSVV